MTTTTLYRHFDSNNNLLYIGISLSALNRLGQHKDNSHWFNSISNVTIEKFNTREEALIAEKDSILLEKPLYNKVYNTIKTYLISYYTLDNDYMEDEVMAYSKSEALDILSEETDYRKVISVTVLN